MSSRTLLLRAVALVAAVAFAFGAIAYLTRTKTSPVVGASQSTPGPVLLVPGYGGGTAGLEVLAGKLRAAGREAAVITLPGDGTGDLRGSAEALATAVDAALAAGAPSVDVVGYSAGGIVARLYTAGDGGTKVRRVVTLGSPHHGTKTATLAATLARASCPAACLQLVLDSPLLEDLEETPEGPQWLSLWTTQDETVTPVDSARLDGAVNLVLQQACPGTQVTHGELPTAPVVAGIVLQALGTGPLDAAPAC